MPAASSPAACTPSPRVLDLDLARLEGGEAVRPGPPRFGGSPEPGLRRLAGWGGAATALALFLDEARTGNRAPAALAVAVGAAVRRGVPTAVRASVLGRAPLSGRLGEGQVGGELGPRLASVADVLVVRGESTRPGTVLLIDADGAARLVERPALRGTTPAQRHAALTRELGPVAVLTLGEAGERGVSFASLASGGPRPSFVGRGGLGAALGATGLAAIVVSAAPVEPAREQAQRASELRARLSASPRLEQRATRGTHELNASLAARGVLERAELRRLAADASTRATERHGCRGCPTPCGWTFARDDGGEQRAHFSATRSLGADLGLGGFDDALALLSVCDRLGVDAKEVGAALDLACLAAERGVLPVASARGDARRLAVWIEELVRGVGPLAALAAGPARFAARHGLPHTAVRGQTVRPERGRAELLGQCTSAAGSDPMRSFPFLFELGDPARVAAVVGALPLPAGGALASPGARGTGRLVAWHEALVSGVDLTGFCAFSTAGLLADGLASVDELAGWILPPALARDPAFEGTPPGERLLAAGASLALVRRALNRAWGATADEDAPPWAAARLAAPGLFAEYALARGLAADGGPSPEAWARLATPALARHAFEVLAAEDARAAVTDAGAGAGDLDVPRASGRVTLRDGAVEQVLLLPLPAPLADVLAAWSSAHPDAAPAPAVFRAGRRLALDARVEDGDALDLVTAIAGG